MFQEPNTAQWGKVEFPTASKLSFGSLSLCDTWWLQPKWKLVFGRTRSPSEVVSLSCQIRRIGGLGFCALIPFAMMPDRDGDIDEREGSHVKTSTSCTRGNMVNYYENNEGNWGLGNRLDSKRLDLKLPGHLYNDDNRSFVSWNMGTLTA